MRRQRGLIELEPYGDLYYLGRVDEFSSEAFIGAVQAQDGGEIFTASDVRRGWYRCVPCGKYDTYYVPAQGRANGAFEAWYIPNGAGTEREEAV